MESGQPVPQRKAGFLETMKAVGASFFGVRGRGAHERDLARLNPVHVIIAGLLLAVAFVLTLVAIVRSVVG
ncbi:MAG: DUF2970 domain-containing protein [Burkholderiales bacterium]|nr:MAG: DUF2970 domain-containing protein [Burkholderiales bacterium]